ncbi:MAG: ribonuclease P protein component [Bacteroidales bacterium]|nr:ribonuclease P protein component [Bacteroidales bacterium]
MDGQIRNTLPKKERLCGKTGISRLLAKGKHGNVPGLRYLCLAGTEAEANRIMVSVPKKMFKRAVKRNLLKRRIRESWRRQKHLLTVEGGVDLLFMYPSKEILSYEDIYAAVGKVIDALNDRYGRNVAEDIPVNEGQEE